MPNQIKLHHLQMVSPMLKSINVVLADDHVLLRNALANFVSLLGYHVMFECSNGKQLIDKLDKENLPDIVLMDINMPEMDGYETSLWLKRNYPSIKILALSMYNEESSIIRMIKNGARGYILKENELGELKEAIDSIVIKGYYYSDLVSGRLIRSIQDDDDDHNHSKATLSLHTKHIEFLKLAATELTYKEVARQMHLSPRTVDGYRDELFDRLQIKSRVGLVLFAIKNGIIHPH